MHVQAVDTRLFPPIRPGYNEAKPGGVKVATKKLFTDAVVYGLLRTGKPDITLKLEAIHHMYEGIDVL